MILLLHLVIAFGSMAYATYILFFPSKAGIRIMYALIALVVVSGFGLVFTMPAHMAEVCTMGLVYLGYVSYALVVSQRKLAEARRWTK